MNDVPLPTGHVHLAALTDALPALATEVEKIDAWGRRLAEVLSGGGRLLAVGNGGSAALAEHLTGELVGRYRDERPAFSALALHADGSSLTSITNDYGPDEAFARQVAAHGRPGDVLVALSTSGKSANVLAAVEAARECGLTVWAMTGRRPNPLAEQCDDAICADTPATATAQEVHQVAVHLLCAAFDREVCGATKSGRRDDPSNARLTVVGDALLDRDVEGSVGRLCPDAPAPVVDEEKRTSRPGGAGLAAALAASDGLSVTLITALAKDPAGRELAALLAGAGVEVVNLGLEGTTPEKVRVRSDGRSLIRLDRGGPVAVGPATDAVREALTSADAVLVSDYGRGVCAEEGLRSALSDIASSKPVVWDPHPKGMEPVPGARLVTPNKAEAAGLAPETTGEGMSVVAARARVLAARWRADGVAVTMDSEGALLAGKDGEPFVAPAPETTVGDPCGAGDRFASRVAGLLAVGTPLREAVARAVADASRFVSDGGAAGVSFGSRKEPEAEETLFFEDAGEVAAHVRAGGGVVVATGGCFDLLHAGHVQMLRAARALGDCLIVCLNSDVSVRRLKGSDRPLVHEEDRAAILLALGCVDAVVLFDEDTPEVALERLRPDVFAKGADYAVSELPEAKLLDGWGGEAAILPYVEGRSTTRLIEEAVSRGVR